MIKKLVKCAAFLVLTAFLVLAIAKVVPATDLYSAINLNGFYMEEKDSLDMVVIGASEVYTGYLPTKVWKDCGITSYAMGFSALRGDLYQYLLQEILEYQSPDVVAIEVNGFVYGDEYLKKEGPLRNLTDNMRWSDARRGIIENLVEEDKRKEYYNPILAYHGGWNDPKDMLADDYVNLRMHMNGTSNLKGVKTSSKRMEFETYTKMDNMMLEEKQEKALRGLLEFCQEAGLKQVIFYRAPHALLAEDQTTLYQIGEIVESYGYDWLNFQDFTDETQLDAKNDFYNEGHMNIYGAEKWTNIMEGVLTTLYDINTEHSDKQKTEWDRAAHNADMLFEHVKMDIEQGNKCTYSELSFFGLTPYEELPDGSDPGGKYRVLETVYSEDGLLTTFGELPAEACEDL